MAQAAPSAGARFAAFRAYYKPRIRPPETLPRLRAALGVDAGFLAEFGVLRPYLKPILARWPELFMESLAKPRDLPPSVLAADGVELRALLKAHAHQTLLGRFDEAYLDHLEDLALYFIYHDVKSIWVAGAYQELMWRGVETTLKRAEKRKAIRVAQLLGAQVSALALELNQIQRVYMMYERRQAEAPIADLERGGLLRVSAEPARKAGLDPEIVALAQVSFARIAPQADRFARSFYHRLFEIAPELRPLFPLWLIEQRAKLTRTLATLVAGLGDLERMRPELATLGARHLGYGAEPAHYKLVGKALLAALAEADADNWTDAHLRAWTRIYQEIADVMIAGAERAAAEAAVTPPAAQPKRKLMQRLLGA